MRRVKDVLRDRRGSSLLLVLIIFVVCMVAGTSTLMAASTANSRTFTATAEQQAYFSARSASQLLQSEIERIQVVHTQYLDGDRPDATVAQPADGALAALLCRAYEAPGAYTATLAQPGDLEDAQVVLTMDAQTGLTVTVTATAQGRQVTLAGRYVPYRTPGVPETDEATGSRVQITQVTWGLVQMTPQSEGGGKDA